MNVDTLKLLELAQRFEIKEEDSGLFVIIHKTEDLEAVIENSGNINYYVSGIYNSGTDYREIDMNALTELKEFCELVVKREDMKNE